MQTGEHKLICCATYTRYEIWAASSWARHGVGCWWLIARGNTINKLRIPQNIREFCHFFVDMYHVITVHLPLGKPHELRNLTKSGG